MVTSKSRSKIQVVVTWQIHAQFYPFFPRKPWNNDIEDEVTMTCAVLPQEVLIYSDFSDLNR